MENNQKINKNDIQDIINLTPVQEGMLFHYLRDTSSNEYFEQLCLGFEGKIDIDILKKTIEIIIQSNEVLRSTFRWENIKNPVQVVLKTFELNIKQFNLTEVSEEEKIKLVQQIKDEDKREKFNLSQIPFRITLCKLHDERYEMIVSYHHILFDGWSTGIFLKDFMEIYEKLNKNIDIKKLNKASLKEYSKLIKKGNEDAEEAFWKTYLCGDFCSKSFLINKKHNEKRVSNSFKVTLKEQLVNRINSFTKTNSITLASLIYCAWGILLQRYNACNDIVFGTTVSGRNVELKGIENLMGMFINTLPLRINTLEEDKISDLLSKVNKALLERKEFEYSSIVDIKKYINMNSIEDLFDSIVVIENYPISKSLINNNDKSISINSYFIDEETNYNIMIGVSIFNGIEIDITYNENLFSRNTISRMSEHFQSIITNIINNPKCKAKKLNMITGDEKELLLYKYNMNTSCFPLDKTINYLFEESVKKYPDTVAIIHENKSITYKELDIKANQLSNTLRKRNVNKYDIVALMVEHSIDMIVAMLAIMKSGCAYLPVDPAHPNDRVKYMFENSGAKLLLSQSSVLKNRDNINEITDKIIDLNNYDYYQEKVEYIKEPNTSMDLAYIIYTSGTSGFPKGVMVEHRNAINYIYWFGEEYGIKEGCNNILLTDYTFDPSVGDIWGTLLFGGTLHIVSKHLIFNKELFEKYIDDNQIYMINYIPTMLEQLIPQNRKFESVKIVVSGGERLTNNLKDKILEKGYVLYNNYGPTEGTIDSMFDICSKEYETTLGGPISNMKCYVFDQYLNLSPIGVVGELYLAGEGITRGYLNNEKLTNEKFILNPHIENERLYRTGDLVKRTEDGKISFIGRIDNQVKINGIRIETQEIENQLLKHAQVKSAAVIPVDIKGQGVRLVAYIVSNKELQLVEVRKYLAEFLPHSMLPAYVVNLKQIDLTHNGKINREKLVENNKITFETEINYIEPTTEIEKKIEFIWKELLNLDRVSVNSNFFEVGGNSLLIIRLNSKLKQSFCKDISVADMFTYTTIREMAKYIGDSEKENKNESNVNRDEALNKGKERKMQRIKKRGSLNE